MVLIKFLTLFSGFLALASGACMLKRTPPMTDDEVMVICVMVKDLKSEMMKLPTDKTITRMWIMNSKIPKIETGTFERLGTKLKRLEILHVGLEEIEDHAFKGLSDLTTLVLEGNKLTSVKVAWVEDLTSLTEVHLDDNLIEDSEDGVIAKLPKLKHIDIRNNMADCFKLAQLSTLKDLDTLLVSMNPLSWKCMIDFVDWKKNHPHIKGDTDSTEYDVDKILDAVRDCLKNTPADAAEEVMDTCVETKMNVIVAK